MKIILDGGFDGNIQYTKNDIGIGIENGIIIEYYGDNGLFFSWKTKDEQHVLEVPCLALFSAIRHFRNEEGEKDTDGST